MEPEGFVPSCPRCGYDLSGALRARTEGAAGGVCSECGLGFTWHDVLNPEDGIPTWFVERRTGGGWGMARRAIDTFSNACFRPRWFWDTVRMQFPIRAWRLGMFAAFLLILTHLAIGLTPMAMLIRSFYVGQRWSFSAPLRTELAGLVINPYFDMQAPMQIRAFVTFEESRTADALLAVCLGAAFVMPLVPLLLRGTLAAHRVRPAQVARVMVYSWACLPLLAMVIGIARVLSRAASEAIMSSAWGVPTSSLVNLLVLVHRLAPIHVLALGGSLVWLACMWRWAWSRYLGLPHGTGVAVLSLAIGTLVSLLLLLFLIDGIWYWLFE